jgi:putative transposon-encoded protein
MNKSEREVYFERTCWQDGNSAHILINKGHVLQIIERD